MSDLDRYFPKQGPCLLCCEGYHNLDARHSLIDASCDRVNAGEEPKDVAADYDISVAAVRAALEHGGEEGEHE